MKKILLDQVLFVSFIINYTFCDLLDVQEVLIVNVIGEVVATACTTTKGK